MKMMKKLLIFFSLLMCFGIFQANDVKAAPGIVKLTAGKTYTKYDVTGNGRKDKIIIQKEKKQDMVYRRLSVTVNGSKQQLKAKDSHFYDVDAKLISLKNGKKFLYLYAGAEDGDGYVCGIYRYVSGKWKEVVDIASVFKNYGMHLNGNIASVSGNNIKVRFYVMSWSTGPSTIDYTYTYKNGTLKRTGSYGTYKAIYVKGKNTRTFYAAKSLPVYQKANGAKKIFTVKKGGKVKIVKCALTNGKMYIQIKYGRKTGWIKAATRTANFVQFSNVMYAG